MRVSLVLLVALILARSAAADEKPVFSGPQVGEKLAPFIVRGAYDDTQGKELDFIASAGGKPLLLVFVHEVTRPSIAVTRMLMDWAATRKKDGLHGGIVFLTADATETAAFLKRARHAMPEKTPVGISMDGREGPGAYGLNRNVSLTVLVGRENRVTANFALVQPSVQADLPRIVKEVVKLIGGDVPTLQQLGAARNGRATPRDDAGPDPKLRELLAPMIRKGAAPEEVDRAAERVTEHMKEHPEARRQVSAIAQRIIQAGKLEDYGTPRAQEHLRRWAEQRGAADDKPKTSDADR